MKNMKIKILDMQKEKIEGTEKIYREKENKKR